LGTEIGLEKSLLIHEFMFTRKPLD